MFRLHRFVHSSRTVQLVCCAFLLLGSGCTNSLNRAISREHPEAIQKFLKAGADVNERDDDGCTPLIYAAQSGDLALIKILVERGATVNSVDNGGGSALGYLVSREHHKNAEIAFLLARGADVNHANKETLTPLHLAVMQSCPPEEAAQQTELVMALLYAGADANRRTQNGELPLHLAAAVGQPDQVLEQLCFARVRSSNDVHVAEPILVGKLERHGSEEEIVEWRTFEIRFREIVERQIALRWHL